jgi:hypothetical protein
MYKINDRVVFHTRRKTPKGTVIGVEQINISSIPMYSVSVKYDIPVNGYEIYETEISGHSPSKNRLERNFRKILFCNNCGKEETLIENSDGDMITNLIEICINHQEDEYEFFCSSCLGVIK